MNRHYSNVGHWLTTTGRAVTAWVRDEASAICRLRRFGLSCLVATDSTVLQLMTAC